MNNKILGQHGEDLVVKKLINDGYHILARNYRKRYGEIDIIAKKKDIVAFVEVKTRANVYGDLSEVITNAKQKKIINVAKEYIATHTLMETVWRFDVALLQPKNNELNIMYIPNAFTEK